MENVYSAESKFVNICTNFPPGAWQVKLTNIFQLNFVGRFPQTICHLDIIQLFLSLGLKLGGFEFQKSSSKASTWAIEFTRICQTLN